MQGEGSVKAGQRGYNSRHLIAYAVLETPASVISAMKSLQGYLFDIHDKYSLKLDLQLFTGLRSIDASLWVSVSSISV